MDFFKIDGVDYSWGVNQLNITKTANYNAQTNAAGNTVVDLINHKRTITVGFAPLYDFLMTDLQSAIDKFNVSISFLNPVTGALEENVNCIIPANGVEYYTIQDGKTMFNAFTIEFQEL